MLHSLLIILKHGWRFSVILQSKVLIGLHRNCSQGVWLIWKLFHTLGWSYRLKSVCITKRLVWFNWHVSLAFFRSNKSRVGLQFTSFFQLDPSAHLRRSNKLILVVVELSVVVLSLACVVLFSSNRSRVVAEVGVSHGNGPFLSEACSYSHLCAFYYLYSSTLCVLRA